MFHPYGLIVGIAIVAGWSVAERIEPKVSKALPWILVFGLVGARLYHVIDLWEYYSQNPGQIMAVWNGGLGIYGAIMGGVVGLALYKRDFWELARAVAVALPLSQAIGRWGNLVNDELWGRGGAPLFLYESGLDLILFSILWRMRNYAPGRVVGAYLLGYGLIRLMLEPMKPSAWWVGYALSVLFVVSGGVLLWVDRRRLT